MTRRWKLPDPEGDHWHFEFPFTVGGKDVFGLSVFLVDYFESHMGESMGAFYTDGARFGSVEAATGAGYTIDTTIWLAPYDLGVSQQVHLKPCQRASTIFFHDADNRSAFGRCGIVAAGQSGLYERASQTIFDLANG